ncbi:MAG: HPr kinase/phosphorylase [Planktomarina sp.]
MTQDVWRNCCDDARYLVHGTAVCLDQNAVLFVGPSGSGKSTLALRLMAMGCSLVADDRVWVQQTDHKLCVTAPHQVAGRIEAYGFGLLHVHHQRYANLHFAVDLSQANEKRWQSPTYRHIFNCKVPVYRVHPDHDPTPALYNMLRYTHGRDDHT